MDGGPLRPSARLPAIDAFVEKRTCFVLGEATAVRVPPHLRLREDNAEDIKVVGSPTPQQKPLSRDLVRVVSHADRMPDPQRAERQIWRGRSRSASAERDTRHYELVARPARLLG